MKKWYYDRESDLFFNEDELRDEFMQLVELDSIEYNKNQFEDYINNCVSKNGQLEIATKEETKELNAN